MAAVARVFYTIFKDTPGAWRMLLLLPFAVAGASEFNHFYSQNMLWK